MPRFRPRLTPPVSPPASLDLLTVGQLIDELMQPGHFFVAPDLHLTWTSARAEDMPWEIFRGRLLPPSQTRQQARFLSWHVAEEGGEPMLSVRLDVNAGVVHMTRGILCYIWEGYDAGGGVIESREVQRWTTELVGSAELDRFPDIEELRDELVCLVWQAIVGTSKLPLNSVEAPLPTFTFGQLHYVYRPWTVDLQEPMRDWQLAPALMERPELSHRERARILEAVLREPSKTVTSAADLLSATKDLVPLLRTVFNEVSLSPVTRFMESVRFFAALICERGRVSPVEHLNLCGGLLRQLSRHLTAYDLVTFHHRGANYPDALLLDEFLADYIVAIIPHAELFLAADKSGRLRRRAMRQGCLLRRHYEGLPVPDAPTSPGENNRVLPAGLQRVPEHQVLNTHRRNRQLYAGQPLSRWRQFNRFPEVLAQSLCDLHGYDELLELGTGLFIDRPLGYGKEPGEPDYTPQLAHKAFSRSIARQRLKELAALATELHLDLPADLFPSLERVLEDMPVRGVHSDRLAEPLRPAVALADVRRVAEDFVIVRTIPGGLREFLSYFDSDALPERPGVVVMIQSPRGPVLGFFDDDYQVVLEAQVDHSTGFVRRAGVELPVAGLRIVGPGQATVGQGIALAEAQQASRHRAPPTARDTGAR
jgi:hypothetical protein